ncbi:MAG TPA: 16S rRNA (guanine(966)-N(2))-methyltransferase RsmD [Terriglobia bacterium]|nr:16S rRNA (guanine(966)-N(2))-methyltransferase RsmD [Terriglobia bacterium]
MRIISGKYRGLTLKTLKGPHLRPTSDQMRETLFDVLGPGIVNSTFLDAYAGSGAVGLEALSRGARDVVFIEHHRPAALLIRANLAALNLDGGAHVISSPVSKALDRLAGEGDRFDFVFVDPPYVEYREYHHTLRQLGRSGLLLGTSLVVAEHSRHTVLEDAYGNLHRSRELRHGDTQLSFYRLANRPAIVEASADRADLRR